MFYLLIQYLLLRDGGEWLEGKSYHCMWHYGYKQGVRIGYFRKLGNVTIL
jgi:hypothetical protein